MKIKIIMQNRVIILAWSESDKFHTDKIQEELNNVWVLSEVYFWSAHKETKKVLEIIEKYNKEKVIFITVAWRSNALSWVVAWNTIRPVIACPPFKDKMDYIVNINSTLQMPSKTPVLTVIEPNNVALACKAIFDLSK